MLQRLRLEVHCLATAVNPMEVGVNGWFRKLLTLILVGVWAILVLDLSAAQPSQLTVVLLTAFVFLIIGRMWGVEAEFWLDKLNPITITLGDDDE